MSASQATGGVSIPCDLLVTAAGVVTVDPNDTILRPGAIAVSGEKIVAVGTPEQLAQTYAPAKRIDAPACWIFPGLINTHNHLWQTMLKGLGDDMGLIDWIQTLLAPTMPQTHVAGERMFVGYAGTTIDI